MECWRIQKRVGGHSVGLGRRTWQECLEYWSSLKRWQENRIGSHLKHKKYMFKREKLVHSYLPVSSLFNVRFVLISFFLEFRGTRRCQEQSSFRRCVCFHSLLHGQSPSVQSQVRILRVKWNTVSFSKP